MLFVLRDYRSRVLIGIVTVVFIWFLFWQGAWEVLGDTARRIQEYSYTNRPIPHDPPSQLPEEHEDETEDTLAKENFIEISSNTTIEGQFDPSPIRALCDAQHIWTGDIIFDAVAEGGIGNVRQDILACMRYAIDAGAGIILPVIKVRGDDLKTLDTGVVADTNYMFDRDTFVSRMALACPQMPLYESLQDLEAHGPVLTTVTAPRDLPQDQGTVFSVKPDLARKRSPLGVFTRAIFLPTLAYYPVCRDDAPFADTFGQLLPFRKDVERLAAAVIYELSRRFKLEIDPSIPIQPSKYLSVHLRTSIDAAEMGWPGYDIQVPRYIKLAKEQSLSVVYVASGDVDSAKKFAKKASSLRPPISVVSKRELLSAADLKYLDTLAWDQQALVDYLVLLKGSYFAGIAASSFAANVAMRRRVVSKSGTCGKSKTPARVSFKDELSELLGKERSAWSDAMWP